MMRFSRFSTDQAKSPMRRAPTTRPLPFSVWKARRTRVSDSRSDGFSSQSGNRRPMVAISSPASSMKSASSSGSTAGGARSRRASGRRGGAGAGRSRRAAGARRRASARLVERDRGSARHCPACTRDRRARPAASPCSTRCRRSRPRADRCTQSLRDRLPGPSSARDVFADAPHHFHRAIAAEQQQSRGDAARERRRGVEARLVGGRVERLAEQFLDAREVDDALAQHRLGDLAEFRIGLAARRRRARRHDEPDERVVEPVLDTDQGRRDRDQRVLLGRHAARDDVGEPRRARPAPARARNRAPVPRACRRSSSAGRPAARVPPAARPCACRGRARP